jgi:pimeloyl-ACP methyl ester carboxylesterase
MSLVEMHEYGKSTSPTILLLHAFGMHWSMWQGVIDNLRGDYHVLAPSLEEHEDEGRTTFTTVEHNALSLSDWLCQNGCQKTYAIVSVSLGGAVAVKLLSLETVDVSYAVIDAGIIPVGLGRAREFFEVTSNLAMFDAAHSLRLIRLLGLYGRYGRGQMERFNGMMKTITQKTARNVFYGVDTYALPDHLPEVTTRVAYWYGSLEEKERKPAGKRVERLFPNAVVRTFDGYGHAQMCLADPGAYADNVRGFIAGGRGSRVAIPGTPSIASQT